jgi:hypothetical protein
MHVSITGLGRGGTTIMGEIFSKHPDVEYRFEQLGHFMTGRLRLPPICPLGPADLTDEGRVILQKWAQTQRPSKLLVEKDPRHVQRLHFLRAAYPDVRIIYMVRHPLDLTCSVLKAWKKQGKTYDQWLNQRQERDIPGLRDQLPWLGHAQWWGDVVWNDLACIRDDPLVRIVRYEDLLANPRAVIAPLLLFAGLFPALPVMNFLKRVSANPKIHVSAASAHLYVPGHKTRVGRWKTELKRLDAELMWKRCGGVAEELGYEGP